jgi:large subunit ribosomal protein L35
VKASRVKTSDAVVVEAPAQRATRFHAQRVNMPKVKTKNGTAKRFRVRASDNIKRSQANLRHILTKKSTKRKRHLRGTTLVNPSDKRAIKAMLPYA